MIRLPTRTTRTDTLVPYTTLVRSDAADRARRRSLGLHRQLEAERGDRRAGERIRAAAVVLPAAPRRREALSAGGSVMWSHVARRLAATVPILLGLSVAVFAMMALVPGDPATAHLGNSAPPATAAGPTDTLDLHDPPPQ